MCNNSALRAADSETVFGVWQDSLPCPASDFALLERDRTRSGAEVRCATNGGGSCAVGLDILRGIMRDALCLRVSGLPSIYSPVLSTPAIESTSMPWSTILH